MITWMSHWMVPASSAGKRTSKCTQTAGDYCGVHSFRARCAECSELERENCVVSFIVTIALLYLPFVADGG